MTGFYFYFQKRTMEYKHFEGAKLCMIHDLCSNKCKLDTCVTKTQVNQNKNAPSELISSHCENTFLN